MKVSITQYQPLTPPEPPLDQESDHITHEDDLDHDRALLLLRRLRASHSYLHFDGETCTVDLALAFDSTIEVEIWSFSGFWAMSDVSEGEAESILGVAYRGEEFSGSIPGTGREWGAWNRGV